MKLYELTTGAVYSCAALRRFYLIEAKIDADTYRVSSYAPEKPARSLFTHRHIKSRSLLGYDLEPTTEIPPALLSLWRTANGIPDPALTLPLAPSAAPALTLAPEAPAAPPAPPAPPEAPAPVHTPKGSLAEGARIHIPLSLMGLIRALQAETREKLRVLGVSGRVTERSVVLALLEAERLRRGIPAID